MGNLAEGREKRQASYCLTCACSVERRYEQEAGAPHRWPTRGKQSKGNFLIGEGCP